MQLMQFKSDFNWIYINMAMDYNGFLIVIKTSNVFLINVSRLIDNTSINCHVLV